MYEQSSALKVREHSLLGKIMLGIVHGRECAEALEASDRAHRARDLELTHPEYPSPDSWRVSLPVRSLEEVRLFLEHTF